MLKIFIITDELAKNLWVTVAAISVVIVIILSIFYYTKKSKAKYCKYADCGFYRRIDINEANYEKNAKCVLGKSHFRNFRGKKSCFSSVAFSDTSVQDELEKYNRNMKWLINTILVAVFLPVILSLMKYYVE